MPRLLLLLMLILLGMVGCARQQTATRTETATVAEIEDYFTKEGFTFTSSTDAEGTKNVGLSANGFLQLTLYGKDKDKPTLAAIVISGGPTSDDLVEYLPYMDALAALVTPTWADAPTWIRTQMRSTPTYIMNTEETTHSGYRIIGGGSPEVINLIFTTE